ncbi:MAG TPA: choice-of-anchor D domain-containing protein [Solirubrobacteraceae bacterium]
MSSTRLRRSLTVAAACLAALAAGATSAQAAITVTRAELNGTQLRAEGTGALPNHSISINPGAVRGTSDANGQFKVQTSPYTSSTCQVLVSDGATSASARLAGCTAATPPPPPPSSGPAVSLTPSSLAFAARDVGTTSAAQSIIVKNTGGAPLFINSAATRGANPLDFTQVDDQCSGVTLAAGTSCSVSITFSPIQAGARSATFIVTDNATGSPQTASITGTGTTPAGTTAPPLAIDTRFFTCTGGVCDIGAGSNVFVNNFFSTSFLASNGTPPYTWSGQPPAGLSLRPSGLLVGAPRTQGTSTFPVTVTDAAGASATGQFSLTATGPPPPTPPGCQTGGVLREALSGPAINGRTPSGQATADETRFSGCGGFSILFVQVNNVNRPDGTQLWVTLDFKPVGTITLRGGSGTMAPYNLGRFGVSRDAVRVYDRLPDQGTAQQILIGGSFLR